MTISYQLKPKTCLYNASFFEDTVGSVFLDSFYSSGGEGEGDGSL